MAGGKASSNKPPSSSSASHHRKPHRESATNNPNSNPKKPSPSIPSSNSKPSPSSKHKPSPKPNPNPVPENFAPPPFPPPPPAYGFHMLDRRTIVLADGSARSYFALPPDYQDFPPQLPRPPIRPHGPDSWSGFDRQFPPGRPVPGGDDQYRQRNQDYWNSLGVDGSRKRKFGDERDEVSDEFARQRQQLLQYGNMIPNSNGSNMAGSSSRIHQDEMRGGKHIRSDRPNEIDQAKLRSAFFNFIRLLNENSNQKKKFLADGKQGSLQCLVCGRSEEQSQLQLVEREEIDEDEDQFEAIDKLTSHGINAGDVKKLQDAGIYTCNGLMMHTKKNLTSIKGLSEAKVDKICEAVEKIVNFGYITGSDALLRRKAVVRITTGSQALDELLGGGIETMQITEAFGEFRSGKTQLAHTLCVSTQLPTSMKGGNGKVAYIDTEGTFRPDRIVPIAERFGMDAGAVLDNIIYARAYTYEHQYNLLLGLAAKMSEEPFRLLIVDSVIALFRVDFTGRGELAERQQKLAQMLSRLTKIAEEFNVAVYMTNQVIADPGGGVFISDPKKPAGGHVLAHAATVRLMFRKGKGEQRVCKVFDAPNLPESEAIFQITAGGIADAKD